MNLPKNLQSIFLLASVLFPFYWYNQTYLSNFTLKMSGVLILIYFFHQLLAKRYPQNNSIRNYQNISNIFIVTTLTLLLVLSTEGTSSPLFFLLDFLLFFIAIFTENLSSMVLALAIILGFLLNEPYLATNQLTNLVSLLLMAPLASIFSTHFKRLIAAQNQIKTLSHQTKDLQSQLSGKEDNTLLWLSLEFKHKLANALDLISQIHSQLNHIPYHQKDQLSSLYHDLKALFLSGAELEEKIDAITDEN